MKEQPIFKSIFGHHPFNVLSEITNSIGCECIVIKKEISFIYHIFTKRAHYW